MKCVVLTLVFILVLNSGKGDNVPSDSVPSSASKDLLSRLKRTTERDPYVFNLFEVVLTTLESKLRRVENMDKALQHLAQRLDFMEGQLSLTLNTTTKMVHLLDVRLHSGNCFRASEAPIQAAPKQVTRVVRHRPYTGLYFEAVPTKRKATSNTVVRGPASGMSQRLSSIRRVNNDNNPNNYNTDSTTRDQALPIVPEARSIRTLSNNPLKTKSDTGDEKMENQLNEVFKRVTIIDTKLSNLQEQLDTNSITRQTEELMASASESYRIGIGLGDRLQAVEKQRDLGHLENSVKDVRNSVEVVNRRLEIHTQSTNQNFAHMTKEVSSMKSAIDDLTNDMKKGWCAAGISSNNSSTQKSSSETCVSPFVELNQKTDEILLGMVRPEDLEFLETDSLRAKQESQGMMLENLKRQVEDKSSKIIKNLQEVKKDLRRVRLTRTEVNPVELLQRTSLDIVAEASSPPSDILDQGYSCLELLNKGQNKSGTYHLKIRGTTYWFLQVYCDMTTAGGGWTVLQRRDDFGEPRQNFSRTWTEYKHGFGHPERELWLGNENIYMLTNTEEYILRVELEDFDGSKRYAEYSTFKLHDENDLYKLEIGGYNGTAGDALNDPWYGSNLSPFSTLDSDNDRSSLNCAAMLKGGWWWRSCGRGLNGLYLTTPNDFTARQGIVWFRWRGWDHTLKKTVLMIRPKVRDEDKGIS